MTDKPCPMDSYWTHNTALPPVTTDDLLRVAAADKALPDDVFLLVSRALRGAKIIDDED